MLNRNPKWLSAEVFSSAQKQPKQNASSQNCKENGSTMLRNTREKPLLAGIIRLVEMIEKEHLNVVLIFSDVLVWYMEEFDDLLTINKLSFNSFHDTL